jgi:hypothetical protein
MGRIDNHCDLVIHEIGGEAIDATKASHPYVSFGKLQVSHSTCERRDD